MPPPRSRSPKPRRALGDALDAATTAHAEATRQTRDAAAALADARRALDTISPADAALADTLSDSRAERDAAWHAIRADYLAGRAPPTPAPADALSDRIARADTLADRAIAAAAAAGARAEALARLQSLAAAAAEAATNEAAAQDAHAAAAAQWCALWHPAGLDPDGPAAMQTWLAARDGVLDKLRQAEDAAAALARAEDRRRAARTSLSAVAPHPADQPPQDEPLAAQLARALALQASQQAAARAAADAARARAEARSAEEKARAELADADAARAAWSAAWSAGLATIGLDAASPDTARDALAQYAAIEQAAAPWRTAHIRIAEITERADALTRAVDQLLARLDEVRPADRPAPEQARILGRRLQSALAAQQARAALATDIATQRTRLRNADAELAVLLRLAGVADEADLPAAVEQARLRADAEARLDRADRALAAPDIGDGYAIPDLVAAARGWDPDRALERLRAIDPEIEVLQTANVDTAATLATLTVTLEAAAHGNAAALAAQDRVDAVARMEDASRTFARAHIAATLLDAAVKRFARDRQAPLLARAAEHFATLTHGRYVRLSAEADDRGNKALHAITAAGLNCASNDLSEGARDQLYLALRVAAIEQKARSGPVAPFIADDLLASFDDRRAAAALDVLATLGRSTQVILFTHHAHIATLARDRPGTHVQGLISSV